MTDETFNKLENFKNKNKPRIPVYAYKEEILDLKNSGYSYAQIQNYLQEEHSINTSDRTLSRIINLQESKNSIVAQTEPSKDKVSAFFLKKPKDKE